MNQKVIRMGVIGAGLVGREFASAAARWCHLQDVAFKPEIVAVSDANPRASDWFSHNVPTVTKVTTNYQELLDDACIDAIYCAVPHNLHRQMYVDIIHAGKHLLGEKPFGMDLAANQEILATVRENPSVVVRCSSEFPFFPGPHRISELVRQGVLGRIIEVEAGLWHSSDLNPNKPINWKRRLETNGEYGCMGDLGMHVVHLPFRFGWYPRNVRALLSNIVTQRPDRTGTMVACDTWDNATLACEVETSSGAFPMMLSMKRIAPGHANTWFLRIIGTELSLEYSTKNPRQFLILPYTPGGEQGWHVTDLPYRSAYQTITGSIFEFGFSDSILQMWAAFCDEVANGRDGMQQPMYCATPEEAALSHRLFTAALQSQSTGETVSL